MKDRAFVTFGGGSIDIVTNTPAPKPTARPTKTNTAAACTSLSPCRTCRIRARAHAQVDAFLTAERAESVREARIRKMTWVEPILGRP